MNQVEMMQGELAALSRRVRKLEVLFESRAVLTTDEKAAQKAAETMGFTVEILMLPPYTGRRGQRKEREQRRQLARKLNKDGWSASRIARALNCTDRTAQRMIA